jgi:fructokinase
MTDPRIAVLGEVLIDFKATGPLAFQGYPGGSPFNVAIAAARMGQATAFLSQVSRDLLGQPLKRYLLDNGVNTGWLLESDAPTTVAFVEERDGHAHFVFMSNGAADTLYDPQPRPVLPDSVRFVQFGSISLLAEPTAGSILDIVAAHRDRAVVMLDPNCRPALTPDREAYRRFLRTRCIPLAHVLKLSDQDLDWLEPERPHADIAAELLALGPRVVIFTLGEQGATLYRRDASPVTVAPPPVAVVDTVGAGDTFTGALLSRLSELEITRADLLDTAPWPMLLGFAVRAAAINCTRAGCNPPHRTAL